MNQGSAQAAILDEIPKPLLLLSRTVFLVRMRISSAPKTGLARARKPQREIGGRGRYFELQRRIPRPAASLRSPIARGRKARPRTIGDRE
jgi:hypothetical protein